MTDNFFFFFFLSFFWFFATLRSLPSHFIFLVLLIGWLFLFLFKYFSWLFIFFIFPSSLGVWLDCVICTLCFVMWFLPTALNVKVKKFNTARVNGGSNYDSLDVLLRVVRLMKVATNLDKNLWGFLLIRVPLLRVFNLWWWRWWLGLYVAHIPSIIRSYLQPVLLFDYFSPKKCTHFFKTLYIN